MLPFGNPLGGPFGGPMGPPFPGPMGPPFAGPIGRPIPGPPRMSPPGLPGAGLPRAASMGGLSPFGEIPLRRQRSSAVPRRRGFFARAPSGRRGLADLMRGMNLGGRPRSQSRGRMFDPTKGGARGRSSSRGRSADRAPPQGPFNGGILRNASRGRSYSRGRSRARSHSPSHLPFRRQRSVHFQDGVDYNENFGAGGPGQLQHYEKVKSLVKGGMSEAVNLMRGRSDGQLYVEKRIRVDPLGGRRARAEIETLKKVKGQHHLNQIVEYKMLHNGLCSIMLEYCDGGSLADRIDEMRKGGHGGFKADSIWNVAMGVARGLAFLHDGIENVHQQNVRQQGWDPICHLDLKPCNIFISSRGGESGHRRIVLADFGCCIKLSDIETGREDARIQECGTPEWYPPEGQPHMAQRGIRTGYGTKTDMYMLGATIHAIARLSKGPNRAQLASGRPCGSRYSGTNLNRLVNALCHDDFVKRPPAREIARVAARGVQATSTRR